MWCDVPKGGIFTIVKVESRHTRSQVGYWRVVILVHTFNLRPGGGSFCPPPPVVFRVENEEEQRHTRPYV